MRNGLTQREAEVVAFIRAYAARKPGQAPSFEEIKDTLGLRSRSSIHRIVCQLERKGWVQRGEYGARRALRVIEETADWQPIETAPKDGTVVDLWIKYTVEREHLDGRETDCRYCDPEWGRPDVEFGEFETVEQIEPLRDGGSWRATHWMPRPSPPTEFTYRGNDGTR